jgi:hypothetical protein
MMTKKLLMSLGVCSLLAFPAINANALGFCTDTQVLLAGSNSTGKVVQLKNTSNATCGTNWASGATQLFYLDNVTGNANAMLAAALSAQASGAKVYVVLKAGDAFNQWSTLGSLYAITTP